MINFKHISAITIIGLLSSTSVFAADLGSTPTYQVQIAEDSSVMSNKGSTTESYEDIKVYSGGFNENQSLEPVLIRRNMTAYGLIGEPIMNSSGQKIATVNDVIIDKTGHAILVVVSDKGFLGIGSKLAAFDYKNVINQSKDGDVTMVLSQSMVDRAADFSYDRRDLAKAKIIPSDSISTNALLNGSLYDNSDKDLARIENVYFRSGDASQIIVGFNQTLGMGGSLAAIDFKDLQIIKKSDRVDAKLTSKQAELFKSFKKSVMN